MTSRLSRLAICSSVFFSSFSAETSAISAWCARCRASSSDNPKAAIRSRSSWCVATWASTWLTRAEQLSRRSRISRCSSTSSDATVSPEPPLTLPSAWTTVPSRATSVRPPARGESSSAAFAVFDQHRIADDGRDERLVFGSVGETVEQRTDHATPLEHRSGLARHPSR